MHEIGKYLSLFFAFFLTESNAQVLFHNYGEMHIKPGAFVIVKTNSIDNNNLLENGGELTIERDFINNNTSNGADTNGIYNVQGNWVNNANFTADKSKVVLYGDDQLITGNAITSFYDLELTGTGIKRQTIDAEVGNTLMLNDRELATDEHEMLVSNTDPNSIRRSSGFVSSLDIGKLSRQTDQSTAYLFPTGSSQGVFRYRPVLVKPMSAAPNFFGVRLANTDPSAENFDRSIKSESICEINPLFYHRIYRDSGNDAADLTFHYIPVEDNDWSGIAQWKTQGIWDDTNPSLPSNSGTFAQLTLPSWNDFDRSPFALSNPAPTLEAFSDTSVFINAPVRLLASGNAALNTIDWSPSDNLDCRDCFDPISTPDESTIYIVTGNPGANCEARDTVRINVLEENPGIFLPNAFSPNNDGTNDVLKIYGNTDNIEDIEFLIFNRWGEKIFEANTVEEAKMGWNGKYKGAELRPDVFSYRLSATFKNSDEKQLDKGSITLIR